MKKKHEKLKTEEKDHSQFIDQVETSFELEQLKQELNFKDFINLNKSKKQIYQLRQRKYDMVMRMNSSKFSKPERTIKSKRLNTEV